MGLVIQAPLDSVLAAASPVHLDAAADTGKAPNGFAAIVNALLGDAKGAAKKDARQSLLDALKKVLPANEGAAWAPNGFAALANALLGDARAAGKNDGREFLLDVLKQALPAQDADAASGADAVAAALAAMQSLIPTALTTSSGGAGARSNVSGRRGGHSPNGASGTSSGHRGASLGSSHGRCGTGRRGAGHDFGPPDRSHDSRRRTELEPTLPGILRVLRLEGEPNGLAVAGDRLLVTLDKGDALVTVDRATLTEIGRTSTGQTPHNVAIAGDTAYVTDSRDNHLRALAFADGSQPLTTATGALPESVTVAGEFVVTADADGGAITIVRRDGFQTVGSMILGGHPVRVVALDTTHVLVALNASSQVAVIDVALHHVERKLSVLGHPDGICISPTGAYVAVVSNEHDAVQIFRRSDWALAGTLQSGDGPGACAWLAGH